MRSAIVACLAAVSLLRCHPADRETAREITGGEPARGARAITLYGCGSCHEIPGINGANGQVGPSLRHIAGRTYLAGQLQNTPENMIRWIRQPQSVESGTAMPDLHVNERDARDIAAYLYTLRP